MPSLKNATLSTANGINLFYKNSKIIAERTFDEKEYCDCFKLVGLTLLLRSLVKLQSPFSDIHY